MDVLPSWVRGSLMSHKSDSSWSDGHHRAMVCSAKAAVMLVDDDKSSFGGSYSGQKEERATICRAYFNDCSWRSLDDGLQKLSDFFLNLNRSNSKECAPARVYRV